MRVASNNIEVVFGKGIGHVIEDLLMHASKRIWIMSPWISEKYADFLISKKNKGLEVKVFTSDNFRIESHKRAVKKLFNVRYEWNKITIFVLIAYLSILIVLSFLITPAFLVFSILAAPAKKWLKKTNVEKIIDVEIFDNIASLTHAKIYVIDDKVVIASANLTESGFYKNLEAATIIRDEEVVKNIENYLSNLVHNPSIRKVELSKLSL